MIAGKTRKFLIDTGTSKNYIKPFNGLQGVTSVNRPFLVKSIHNTNRIKEKVRTNIFGIFTDFFVLPSLETFDGIIGLDILKTLNASIDLGKSKIFYANNVEPLYYDSCKDVNYLELNSLAVPLGIRGKFNDMIQRNIKAFADPDEALAYNTNVIANIRTTDEEPVYSRLYPYPLGVSDFVKNEVENLLANGIIRPSRSPYNNPIWVVDKKGVDEFGCPNKRLVIDFRKLNDKTISDKYPIPDITEILSNLGGAKYFTTLDLKSGFHQIELAERDREKTAFSVRNGKYEFCRLPFGLKNAPSIFQRAIDDVLREHIGKCCFVYIDDVIIFSTSEENHIRDVESVLKSLLEANMKVSAEKSKFFRQETEYLGFMVTTNGITTCADKVNAMKNFPQPTTLRGVRSFLGLAGYYRCFIKDFAKIARPLSSILRGEFGNVSASQSKKIKITLNDEQIYAFNALKNILISEDVLLNYPDFKKPFDLTTDASSHAIGAVLSQGRRPITMISRTLSDAEENYATNERELLAIVWALKTLRNYLYGVQDIRVFTDHKPLTFAVSDKNPNNRIRHLKAFVDECNAKVFYKPGKDNVVADALSRQQINNLSDNSSVITEATVHSEASFTNTILSVDKPVNCFRNQIIIEEGTVKGVKCYIMFGKKTRYFITFENDRDLFEMLQQVVKPDVVNAIHCDLPTLARIQHKLIELFPGVKFRYSKSFVTDITNLNDQKEIIAAEHNRAHRAAQENIKHILEDYFFPKMGKKAKEFVTNCRICLQSKYNRQPTKYQIAQTPIPTKCGEILHIDIYSTDSKHFLTCIDKFSKFAVVQPLRSRTIVDVQPLLLQILNLYSNTTTIYCDNEKAFNSNTIKSMLKNMFNIEIVNAPPLHSTSNGQVERFHSTLTEIARSLKLERLLDDTEEVILMATIEYNRSVHSVIGKKPIEVFRTNDFDGEVVNRLQSAQQKDLTLHNASRRTQIYESGDKVLVKTNKRLGNKLTPLYVEKDVQQDLGTTLLIGGRRVHKDNIRT